MTKTITKEQYNSLSENDKKLYYHDVIHINTDTSLNWESKNNLTDYVSGDLNKVVLPNCTNKDVYILR